MNDPGLPWFLKHSKHKRSLWSYLTTDIYGVAFVTCISKHHLLEETDSQTFNGLGRTSGFVGGAERKKIYNMIQEKT
jgi:hypothetical protein